MPFAARPPFDWRLHTRTLSLGSQTLIMGILNVTPDSFSDGGQHLGPGEATDHGLQLLDQGAHLLDLGGESTRPNAIPLSPEEEQARVLPVIAALLKARPEAILSIDTYHGTTARLAIEAGAEIVNDVSGGLWDPAMLPTLATLACGAILMHTRGRPTDWATQPPLPPTALLPSLLNDLTQRTAAALATGIPQGRILLDPGFGFGKLGAENHTLLAGLDTLQRLGYPILVGISRKGFLTRTAAHLHAGLPPTPIQRQTLTTSANTAAILAGAHILRVHEVPAALEAAAIADAILSAGSF